MLNILHSQKGAMFGLDSRIALAIFGVISVLAGAIAAVNTNTITAQGFSKELKGMRTAIEGIHRDLQRGIHGALITDTSANAYTALYDSSVISSTYRSKWLGPYVDRSTSLHPKFGAMTIERYRDDHTTACSPDNPCYLWLTYDSVREKIVTELNKIVDGKNEALPSSTGNIQWDGTDPYTLWYKVSIAIN